MYHHDKAHSHIHIAIIALAVLIVASLIIHAPMAKAAMPASPDGESGLACLEVLHVTRYGSHPVFVSGINGTSYNVQARLRNKTSGAWTAFAAAAELPGYYCLAGVYGYIYLKSGDTGVYDWAHFQVTVSNFPGQKCNYGTTVTNCRNITVGKLMRLKPGSSCPTEQIQIGSQVVTRKPRITVYYCDQPQ